MQPTPEADIPRYNRVQLLFTYQLGEVMLKLMGLPTDTEIVAVQDVPASRTFKFIVKSDVFPEVPVPEGAEYPIVTQDSWKKYAGVD